jgi:hypothetical protein
LLANAIIANSVRMKTRVGFNAIGCQTVYRVVPGCRNFGRSSVRSFDETFLIAQGNNGCRSYVSLKSCNFLEFGSAGFCI